ncbi:MAG: ABC transporter permease [Bacteroidales bacterium]|nr:ABC transporter permease [Bacteroidales bacterium]
MKFSLFIARRYLFSKRSTHIANRISHITLAGIGLSTMALVIVLSVFNGLDHLIKSLFSSFDPDIKIEANQGKTFSLSDDSLQQILKIEGIQSVCGTIEGEALLRYRDRQTVATVKGICSDFARVSGIDSMLTDGGFTLSEGDLPGGIIGQDLAWQLGVGLNFINPLHLYVPKRNSSFFSDPATAFSHRYLFPTGIFSIQADYDATYLLVPVDFAKTLFGFHSGEYSALEIFLRKNQKTAPVTHTLENYLGYRYQVLDSYRQHAYFYKVMAGEKWIILLILSFILIIASFNSISSLSLLLLEKKQDIAILQSMGARISEVRRIFVLQNLFISLIGLAGGLVLGIFFCWMQQHYGIIRFPQEGSFLVSAYPVRIVFRDLLLISGLVGMVGVVTGWVPVTVIKKHYFSPVSEA